MAESRGHELLGSRILGRLCGNHVSGMLKKTLDHIASKSGLPTLPLCGFFQCKLFASHPNHLFMNQRIATERMTAYLQDIQAEIYSQEERAGKTRSKLIRRLCFFIVIVQTSPAHDAE